MTASAGSRLSFGHVTADVCPDGVELSADDAVIEFDTRNKIERDVEFQPLTEWQAQFRVRLDHQTEGV